MIRAAHAKRGKGTEGAHRGQVADARVSVGGEAVGVDRGRTAAVAPRAGRVGIPTSRVVGGRRGALAGGFAGPGLGLALGGMSAGLVPRRRACSSAFARATARRAAATWALIWATVAAKRAGSSLAAARGSRRESGGGDGAGPVAGVAAEPVAGCGPTGLVLGEGLGLGATLGSGPARLIVISITRPASPARP